MPTPGFVAVPPRKAPEGNGKTAPKRLVPFVRAAHEHVEPAFDVSFTPGASAVQLSGSPFEVPSYGFMRAVWLLVTTSGGVAGAGALAADAPWNVIDSINLHDVNGQNIVGPVNGYDLFLLNAFGGYAWESDPALLPDAVTSGAGAVVGFTFALRVPVEITAWDAYGSLGNQNAAAPFRLAISGNTSGNVWSTAPTTIPTVRVRAFLEAWSQPEAADLLGNPQETVPPGHGTTQFWSSFIKTISSGENTIRLERVGNLLRTIILVGRLSAGARDQAMLPDTIDFAWDNLSLYTREPIQYRRTLIRERHGLNPPDGVLVYSYAHDQDGHVGNESRHLWLPSTMASRFEFRGNFDAAGTLKVLTNDVAPGGGR